VRDAKVHAEQLQAAGYEWIDMVVVNLHPVQSLIGQPGITVEEVVGQIDIGGMSMIRSAAKNYRYVTVAVNPDRYSTIIHDLRALEGEVSYATRHRLAQEAFACVAQYDQVIADYLARVNPQGE